MTQSPPKSRFEALLRPHFDVLFASAKRMTASTADAEDLVQDVALKAFERLEEFERMTHPRAWLLKVMYHAFVDSHRGAKRTPVDQATTGLDSEDPDEHAHGGWLPEETFDREVRITRILMAMQRLDRESAALVALRDIEGLSIRELERLTGSPAGTIKSKLHRGRERLGRILERDEALRPELKAIGGGS